VEQAAIVRVLLTFFSFVAIAAGAQGPSSQASLTSQQIIEKANPSVALVLVGNSPSTLEGVGSAIVVRPNGILLTAYHVVKDANAIQVRFKDGEDYDDVRLLGVDRRRDVAAIRISADGLTALQIASANETKAGDPVWVLSNAEGLPWTASTGIISSYQPADEVPGAGSGFRALQLSAPVSPGSSGGVVLDAGGRALGLIVGSLTGGQNLNFAVPMENVLGLADEPVAKNFGSGQALKLPSENRPVQAENVGRSPSVGAPHAVTNSADLARSKVLKSKDPDFILRNFRTLCVDTSKATYFGNNQMKAALTRNKGFAGLHITLVDDPSLADVVLVVGYTFAWDYPFTLRHQNTTMVLLAGKGEGPFSGPAGAASVAKNLIRLLKPYRSGTPAPASSSEATR